MKKSIKLYAKSNIVLGFILVITPLVLVIGNAILINSTDTVLATNPDKEKEILSRSIIKQNSSVAQELNDVNNLLIENRSNDSIEISVDYKVNVPENDVITYGNKLIIDSVGIDTQIFESQNTNLALDKGVWRFPDYGNPVTAEQPVILGAHRWGRAGLSNEFRAKNLFLNLPNVKNGDIIKLVWDGETYEYKVNLVSQNEYIEKLSDLILVTCQDFNTTVRIFVYAELI